MSKQPIEQLIQAALEQLQKIGELTVALPRIQIDLTKDKQHGDFATNIALVLAKPAQRKPRDIAELIVKHLPPSSSVTRIEIAGPGFINFFIAPDSLYSIIKDIIKAGPHYGHTDLGKKQRILLEFVSSNPTGPLHVGHGRHGAYGGVVADLLEAVGYEVYREYYVNDAGRQMDIVTVSVWLRYLTLCGENVTFPVNAYKGDYVMDIARNLREKIGDEYRLPARVVLEKLPLDETDGGDKEIYIDALIARAKELLGEARYENIFDVTLDMILADISEDLAEFGVAFQGWFSERQFTYTDAIDRVIAQLDKQGLVYEQEGAVWFKATALGDEKDRVLQRANGVRTYFGNDLAYHFNKFERGFDRALTVLGSDHHGYVPRVMCGLRALGIEPDKWQHVLVQFVTLYRGDQQVPMSTRSGSFVTLRELRAEVGNDAARYFYVMRKREQPIDFDLDLAKSKSNENPVYYVQYAHARICSVFRQLAEKNLSYNPTEGLAHLTCLVEERELALLATLMRYQDVIIAAAEQYEPHILTNYLRDLANDFHSYYNSHQFLVDDEKQRNARLSLITATRQILANGLKLVGVSAPESM